MKTVAEIMQKMIRYSDGNRSDIQHFLKVWGYAKTIGELEGLDQRTQYILETAAILHDIACPLCRQKYGNTNGKYQEKEGMLLAADFLRDTGMDPDMADRVVYLVGHHHTISEINGSDYQILIEADYIVNADESSYSPENISGFIRNTAGTAAGTALLKSIYGL